MSKRASGKRKAKGAWPAMQLLEFSVGISRLMKERNIKTQVDLSKVTGAKTTWLSSMFSGNENMTIRTMQALAASLDATVHLVVTGRDEKIRWVPDVVAPDEAAPDLSLGWPVRVDRPRGNVLKWTGGYRQDAVVAAGARNVLSEARAAR